MSGLEIAGAALSLGSAAVGAAGTIAGGNAAASQYYRQANQNRTGAAYGLMEAQNEATQLRMAADESRAASQRKAQETNWQTGQVLSKLQSGAAAGGGSARDATIGQLGAQIKQAGDFQSLMEMYAGENRARGLEDSASNSLYRGQMQNYGLLSGASSNETAARMGQKNAILGAGGTMLGAIGDQASGFIKQRALENRTADAALNRAFDAQDAALARGTVLGSADSVGRSNRALVDSYERFLRRPYTSFGF